MSWGLFILLLIIFIALSVLVFFQFSHYEGFFEIYFLVVIIALFVILLFTVNFNNPVSITYTFKNRTTDTSFVLSVPYNEDTSYSNIMSVTFAGLWNSTEPKINTTPASDARVFNYDLLAVNESVSLLDGKLVLTKLANWQLNVDVKPTVGTDAPINGYMNISLLCNSSQDINGSFEEQ